MSDQLDIHDPVMELCDRLNLDPDFKSMFVTPTTVTVTVYKKNEKGAKYIDEILQTAATEEFDFEVRT